VSQRKSIGNLLATKHLKFALNLIRAVGNYCGRKRLQNMSTLSILLIWCCEFPQWICEQFKNHDTFSRLNKLRSNYEWVLISGLAEFNEFVQWYDGLFEA